MKSKDNLGIPEKDNSVLLIIDVQEKFRPVMHKWGVLIENIQKLIKSFQILKVPIIITEQYPKGLGKTVGEIRINLKEHKPLEKREFSCFNNPVFLTKIKKLKKKHIIICGIESHVCVINTILDAISKGFNVHLVVDAISSRKESDLKVAIKRARQSGAFLTSTEMIIFQLMKTSAFKGFKEVSQIIK